MTTHLASDELRRIADFCDAAASSASRAAQYLDAGVVGVKHAKAQADAAQTAAENALAGLLRAGATTSASEQSPPAEIPFHLLDTPDVRDLVEQLRRALPIAERIDRARGRAFDAPIGGTAGYDVAEALNQLLARLELEAFGPGERVTGGRE